MINIYRIISDISIAFRKLSIIIMDSAIFDRAYGCLLGQAIGDALGTRYEFKNSRVTGTMISNDLLRSNSSHLPIFGGGPFDMEPGQVTDDTEMAMALARSIQRQKTFDAGDVAKSYAYWFYSNPPDIGITTSNAFRLLPKSWDELGTWKNEDIHRTILKSTEEKNKSSLSNGCLMRISPLAIAGSRWPLDILRTSAVEDCKLTHPNPIAHDAVAAYVTAISTLIQTGGDRKKASEEALNRVQTSVVRRLLEMDENPAVPIVNHGADGKEIVKFIHGDEAQMGYLGVALKWAFLELRLHGDEFETALINVISRGGDTDTNGCIAGALLGAYVGASKIPDDWKSMVVNARPRRLANYNWVNMGDAETVVRDLLSATAPK